MAVIILAAGLLPGLGMAPRMLLLLIPVVLASAAFGLAVGLASATLGFALILWQMLRQAGTIGLEAFIDAFLWFAVAKLAASLVALQRRQLRRQAAGRREAEQAAEQQGLLLDEMSHRVRNDMQRLIGMLQAQARSEPQAAQALQRAAGRVQVLGRLHQRLSRRAETAVVDSKVFLEGLIEDLRSGIEPGRPVGLTANLESHALPLAMAADLGLVVNELVTNALKHGFPGNRPGVIRIAFGRDDGTYSLAVADTGIGLAAEPARQGTGQRLIQALASQLGGRMSFAQGEVGGTQFSLVFPVQRPEGGAPPPEVPPVPLAPTGTEGNSGR
ncbi:sensor histidine kinase [Belnapia moabensis]|uniref:sensor histidine kinase n=1 Tax=Belnapia moabensis TaxID=365533 RepID=UPI0006942C41|nr:histidine kinase dimerization/phosphoacceptor domain -containing protein [Belnapia moabensis]